MKIKFLSRNAMELPYCFQKGFSPPPLPYARILFEQHPLPAGASLTQHAYQSISKLLIRYLSQLKVFEYLIKGITRYPQK